MNQRRSSLYPSLLLLLLLIPGVGFGITFPEKPSAANYYVDEATLITEEASHKVDAIASALLYEEKVPLYVVTITSLAGRDAVTHRIEEYAQQLFDHWGIGEEDRNYGMLLLISRGDRKARIELGADWGRDYDDQAEQVMDELIVPAFKRGDFATGIVDGVRGLDAMARGLGLPRPTSPWWFWPLVIGGFVLIVVLIINLFKSGRKGWAWALIAALGVMLFFIISAILSNANSGSGGGFGGGSSGGGGATGSW